MTRWILRESKTMANTQGGMWRSSLSSLSSWWRMPLATIEQRTFLTNKTKRQLKNVALAYQNFYDSRRTSDIYTSSTVRVRIYLYCKKQYCADLNLCACDVLPRSTSMPICSYDTQVNALFHTPTFFDTGHMTHI